MKIVTLAGTSWRSGSSLLLGVLGVPNRVFRNLSWDFQPLYSYCSSRLCAHVSVIMLRKFGTSNKVQSVTFPDVASIVTTYTSRLRVK